jgi:blue copper oxidase
MLDLSRRQFIGGLSALGAAGAVPGMAFSAARKTPQAASAESAAAVSALEKTAASFGNPLRLPGTSGLYGMAWTLMHAMTAMA